MLAASSSCLGQTRDLVTQVRPRVYRIPKAQENSVFFNQAPLCSAPAHQASMARVDYRKHMTSTGNSMLYSFLLFVITLSLQQVYKERLASTELLTIFGGFISSVLFLLVLTFVGNLQESLGIRTGWGSVLLSEAIAAVSAGAVHRVCVTTCMIFSGILLYEVNKISTVMHQQPEVKKKIT